MGNPANSQEPDGQDQAENTGVDNKGQDSKTFSQDEVNDIVAKRVNEINAKNEEKTAKAIQNALADYERKAKLSDEEKNREEQERLKAELANKERDLQIRENRADAREILQEKEIPEIFANYVVVEDPEQTKSNITDLEKVWSEALAKAIDKKLSRKTPETPVSNTTGRDDGGKKNTFDLLFKK